VIAAVGSDAALLRGVRPLARYPQLAMEDKWPLPSFGKQAVIEEKTVTLEDVPRCSDHTLEVALCVGFNVLARPLRPRKSAAHCALSRRSVRRLSRRVLEVWRGGGGRR